MNEYKSEKLQPFVGRESSDLLKLGIYNRQVAFNQATDAVRLLTPKIVPVSIRQVVESVHSLDIAPVYVAQTEPSIRESIDVDHTTIYKSERDSRLEDARQQVRDARAPAA